MNDTNETTTTTTTPRKWTADTTNPPGKIQVGRVNDALSKLRMHHNNRREITGVIGGEEHSFCFNELFGVNHREDVAAVQRTIGERYNYTVTKDNAKDIVSDIEAALPELEKNIPVVDKRITQEQDAANQAERKQAEQERAEKSRLFAIEANRIAAELRSKYPWALGANSPLSGPARAAANLKLELQKTWPGIDFSVRSERYSGGNSVNVSWSWGPTDDEVKTVSDKYQGGHFDGMTDSYESNQSAFSKAVDTVLGQAKYVFERRNSPVFNSEQHEALCRQVCELHHVEYTGPNTKLDYGSFGEYVSHVLQQIIANTSFPAGATLTGIERIPGVDGGINQPQTFYRATYAVSESPAPTEAAQSDTSGTLGTVRRNLEHNGVEVEFPAKPSSSVIFRLKNNGFRWSPRSKVWYKRFSEYAWKTACEIAGVTETTAPAADPGPDRFDMQVEDNMAAACGL